MPPTESADTARRNYANRQDPTWRRRILFPLAAILLALLPFLLLEGALRLFDSHLPDGSDAATAGFGASRLFELDEDEETYTTARHRLLFFGRQEFARNKPARTFRIFGLGGSTVHGRPYENGSSFLKWMELELGGRDSTREYETVNCGGLSYASYRLTTLLDEVLQYDPDLIVLATGHNEFLEDRSYRDEKNRSPLLRWAARAGSQLRTVTAARQLLQSDRDAMEDPNDRSDLKPEVEARLDAQSGYASYHRDDEWRRDVIAQYEESLGAMIDACQRAELPLILVNLGDNLRDCPPFKSEHQADLSPESLQRWQELFDRATEIDDADPAAALKLYRQAQAIDDGYALLAFRTARCCDRLGDMDQARKDYIKARQLDICPLRMVDEMHEQIKRIAKATGTPLVDAEALAVEISPDGIPGNNGFMDHVHPDIGSHQRIGRLLADEAERMGLASTNRTWTDAQRRRAYRIHFRRLGPAYLANGRRRVGWLENWARREQLEDETLPKDARGHLDLGKKRLDYGEVDAAWEQLLLAMAEQPARLEEVFAHACALFCQGRPDLAEQLLVRLHNEPQADAYRPAIELAYTIVALDSGDSETAEVVAARYADSIEQAVADPKLGDWRTALNDVGDRIDQLLADRADLPAPDPSTDPFLVATPMSPADPRPKVRDLLDRAIERNPQSAALFINRARMLFSEQKYAAALADVTRAIELAPEDIEAYKFRAILHMIGTDSQAAVDDLSAAIALDANDPELLRMRAAAYRRVGDDRKADADLEAAEKLDEST